LPILQLDDPLPEKQEARELKIIFGRFSLMALPTFFSSIFIYALD